MRFAPWCALVLVSLAMTATGCKMCASNDDYTYPVKQCAESCGDECGGCSTGNCASACGSGYYDNCGHVRAGSAQGGYADGAPTPAEYVEGEESYEVSARPAKKKS